MVRALLPFLILLLWLFSLWLFLPTSGGDGGFAARIHAFEARPYRIAIGLAAFGLMVYFTDRWWVSAVTRRIGFDPLRRHWSELRNANGQFFCAHCQSIYLVLPPDLDERKPVHCGDCNHRIASYGEMRPLLNNHPNAKFYHVRG